MEKRPTEIKKLKPGGFCLIDDVPCAVESIQISKPGKHGGAKARISAKGVFDDQRRIIVKPADTRIDVPIIEKRGAQVVSLTGRKAHLMDMEDFSMFEAELPEDLSVAEGEEILIWKYGAGILIKGKK